MDFTQAALTFNHDNFRKLAKENLELKLKLSEKPPVVKKRKKKELLEDDI